MTQPEIGKLVRSLRLEAGLTQEKFASELGVTFPTVNRWENNRATPSPLAVEKIEKMLRRRGRAPSGVAGKVLNLFQKNRQRVLLNRLAD
jgi:transcriptional regulator with XRE-family HTH domain